jgi:hypothetical protein
MPPLVAGPASDQRTFGDMMTKSLVLHRAAGCRRSPPGALQVTQSLAQSAIAALEPGLNSRLET